MYEYLICPFSHSFRAVRQQAFVVLFTTMPVLPTQAETIRCPDWRELTLAYEGTAALREADPTANFEAVLASAQAKNISGPLSSRVARSLDASKKKAEAPSSEIGVTSPKLTTSTTCSYTVKSSDTLARIAARELGNGNLWTQIRDLNKSTLKNPNVLKIGQVLKLPCESTSADAPSKPTTPPAPIWTAKKGEDLEAVLKRWAKIENYNLVTDTQNAWTLTAPVSIQGDFRGSVKTLIKGLQRSNPIPRVVFFSNNTLELS